jgi:hypothetical protein
MARGGAVTGAGRGRGTSKGQSKKDFPSSQNGIGKKAMGDIEIVHTDTLIKEVWRQLIIIINYCRGDLLFPNCCEILNRWKKFLVLVILILWKSRKLKKC